MAIGRMEYLRNAVGVTLSAGSIVGGLYAIGERVAKDSGSLALPPALLYGLSAAAVAFGAYTLYEFVRAMREP